MKIKTKIGNILFFLIISSITYPFSYDSAIYTAQKGDVKAADEKMRNVVINAPDRADVLYDAGVLAHEMKNNTQAVAYFARAADKSVDKNLQFQSYFNAGNVLVEDNDLEKALEFYNKALAIEPDNEYACHNRDRVRQMLQEQENKHNQQNENNKDQKKDDQQDQDQKNDQQNQQDQNQEQQNNDSSHDESKNDESQKQSHNTDQGNGAQQSNTRKDGKQQGNEKQNQQNNAREQKRDGDEDLDEKSQNADNKREQQQSKKHEKSPEKQNEASDKNSIASDGKQAQSSSAQAGSEPGDGEVSNRVGNTPMDSWLQGILDEQESRDKAMNKKLMEVRMHQQGGGKNVQNNW